VFSNLLLLSVLTIFGPDGAGTTAFPLLRVPVGPRACAMGESFTGLANDISALFWNPAGLGQVLNTQVAVSHHEWFAGIRDENVSLVVPAGPGCLGAAVVYSTTSDIEIWDPVTGTSRTAASRSGYAVFGYGLPLTNSLGAGFTVKGLYDNLIEQTGSGVCADAGFLFRPVRRLRIGVAGQNLGWGMRYGGDNVPLPITIRLGASLELRRLRLLLDAAAPVDDYPDAHVGGEYALNDILCLRAGYRLGPQDWRSLSAWSGLTAGLGVNVGPFSLDYAFVPYGRLGMTHRLALSTSFHRAVYGRVRIQVREVGSGTPVRAAKFVLEGTQQGNSYTESDGTFVIEGIEPGWLRITATADRYYPATESVLVEPRMVHTVRIVVSRSGHGSLWGVVYAADTRRPLAARVDYSGAEAGSALTNDTTGSFAIRKLRAGEYSLNITPVDSSYAPLSEQLRIEPGRLCSRTFLVGGGALPDATGTSAASDSTPVPAAPADLVPAEPAPPESSAAPTDTAPPVRFGTFDE
jgi:hypothetical protein